MRFGRIGDGTAIKAFSFIPHHNRYFSIHAASAAQMNLLVGIFTVSVNHSVGKSFEYGDFNFIFTSFAMPSFNVNSLMNRISWSTNGEMSAARLARD